VRELLDPASIDAARTAGLPFDADKPQLIGFTFGHSRQWQLHFAGPYAVVSWTNIHDPTRLIFCGDIISGPLASPFGAGIRDSIFVSCAASPGAFAHALLEALGVGGGGASGRGAAPRRSI
jgi:hypothetical protein